MGHSFQLLNAQKELLRRREAAGVSTRPLTWPDPLTHLKPPDTAEILPPSPALAKIAAWKAAQPESLKDGRKGAPVRQPEGDHAKVYPAVLAAISKASLVPCGRVWLLLRWLDREGRGVFDLESVKRALSRKKSPWYVYKSASLRRIINQGEGIFWDRHADGRMWLRSPGRVSAELEGDTLTGLPVYLPIKVLLGSIQQVKAHFFASYESGRKSEDPISQAALREVTGTAERTQRLYNELLDREAQQHYVITDLEYNQANVWELSQEEGRAVLPFVDYDGRRGNGRRTVYCSYRLPDTRERVHEQAPKGRQKAINSTINLVDKRERGKHGNVTRIYHPSAAAAAKAYGRNPGQAHYWPDKGRGAVSAVSLWEGVV